jgi:uncharacterized membrane protein (UPF0127 family)
MSDRGPLRLLHPRSGRVLAERLLVPRSFVGRGLGLMFKNALEPGLGMWIVPCSGIHMFFMSFSIDAVFLDRKRRVVKVCPGLKPWRMVPIVFGAHSVLELPANTVDALGLERGEQLSIEPA